MNTTNLFVSFWNICLDNLPEGSFTHRRIPAADAKLRIDDARQRDALLCLSDDDLLAPYREDALNNHRALCRVLHKQHGIDLSVKDFCSNAGDDADPLYSINPLGCMTLTQTNALLVISCAYSLPEDRDERKLTFEIDPATLEFHVFTSSCYATETLTPAVDPGSGFIGSMRDYADEMDEIVEDAMRRRQISGWLPTREDFAALKGMSEATGQPLNTLLNEALRLILQQKGGQPPTGA